MRRISRRFRLYVRSWRVSMALRRDPHWQQQMADSKAAMDEWRRTGVVPEGRSDLRSLSEGLREAGAQVTMPFDLDRMKRMASNGYVSGAYVSDLVAVVERFRAALEEIAECPNEGPFLRRLARRALDGGA